MRVHRTEWRGKSVTASWQVFVVGVSRVSHPPQGPPGLSVMLGTSMENNAPCLGKHDTVVQGVGLKAREMDAAVWSMLKCLLRAETQQILHTFPSS